MAELNISRMTNETQKIKESSNVSELKPNDNDPSTSIISSIPRIVFPQSEQYQTKYMKTALQRHCAFFDRDGDGVISLYGTFSGLRALGFNFLICLGATIFIHLTMSYQTSPSWIPSIRLPIYLERVNRCQHGSSTKAYDFIGNVVSYPAVESVFTSFDPKKQGGLNYWQLIWMLWNLRDSFDPFGWALSVFWWTGLYLLAADPRSGILSYQAMIAQYDGSLFYLIEQQIKSKKNQ